MKKIFSTAALTVLVGLTLSGCNSPSAEIPEAIATPTASAVSAPRLDENQHKDIVMELEKIHPALGEQRNVVAVQQGCRMILLGDPETAQLDYAKKILRNTEIQPGPPTDAAAKKIIDIIKSNGFCNESAK